MSGPAPWSVKGIDPRAREAAREAARRHGLTIGEWLNQAILANEAALAAARDGGPAAPPSRPRSNLSETLEHLAQRVDANDRRTALAMTGLDRTLAGVVARVEQAEAAAAGGGRVTDLLDELRDAQAVLLERMRTLESDAGAHERQRADQADRLAAAEAAMQALSSRAVEAEAATGDALRALESTLAQFDHKIAQVAADESAEQVSALRAAFDDKLDAMARDFTDMVAHARADLTSQIAATLGGLNPEEMTQALADMSRRVAASERRHAQTIEAVSIEIKRLSESMDRRLRSVEARNDHGSVADIRDEFAEMARTLENRLAQIETRETDALARLGEEVGRVADTLDARVHASETRNAAAIEQVGEQIAQVAELLSDRQDRFAAEITERIVSSEERNGARLSDALAAINARLTEVDARATAPDGPINTALSSFAARLQAIEKRASAPLDDSVPFGSAAPFDALPPMPSADPPWSGEPVRARPLPDATTVEDIHLKEETAADTPSSEEPDPAVPLLDRATIYVEEIQARFASRDEVDGSFGDFDFTAHEESERLASSADAHHDIVEDTPSAVVARETLDEEPLSDEPFTDSLSDPFADIEAAPPKDDDDLFWSTGHDEPTPLEEPVPLEETGATTYFDLPEDLTAVDDQLTVAAAGSLRLDDDLLDPQHEMEREMFGDGAAAPAPPQDDYLAAARRAAQAHAQTHAAGAKRPKPSQKKTAEAPGALRGFNRVLVWGATGVIVAAIAGGAYLTQAKKTPPRGPAPKPPATDAAKAAAIEAPPGSIAEGAARASAARAAAHDEAFSPSGEAEPVELPEAPARAGPLESSLSGEGRYVPTHPASFVMATLEQAAGRGEPVAQYDLALRMLGSGETSEAVMLLKRAAGQGLAMAQYRLAKLHERGEGVAMDLAEARKWTEKAALAGNRKAMHDLGVYYARGEGAPFDEGAAFRWFRQAAEYGVADSQFNLGVLYQQGRGVAADLSEAMFWFSVAGSQGDTDARARAAMIEEQLGEALAQQIRARAQTFRPKPGLARANGEFGDRPWLGASKVQQASTAGSPRT